MKGAPLLRGALLGARERKPEVPCSSGCPTQNHANWGECVRSKRLEVEGVQAHAYNKYVRESQNEYAAARRAGLRPASPFKKDVDVAWRATDATGEQFKAG